MIQKFVLTIILLLFTASAASTNHFEEVKDVRINEKTELNAERGTTSSDALEKAKRTSCNLAFKGGTDHAWGGNAAVVTCPENSIEHTDSWITARLTGETDWWQNQSKLPESVAVVLGEENCPEEMVCYQVSSGRLEVNVTNYLPGARGTPEGVGNGVQWPYNLTNQASTQFVVEYGDSPSARAGWPPMNGLPINASYPPPKIESVSGSEDCDDQDEAVRPEVCGTTTHFIDPDSDGDGFGDLTVVETEEEFMWKFENESVAFIRADVVEGARGQVIVLSINEAQSRPELVEAIASKSGLSKADSKKALDTFIYINMEAAYSKLDKSSPYIYNARPEDRVSSDIDKASPKLQEELVRKDQRISELEARIQELESDVSMNSSSESAEGNDLTVRKKPGRAEGIDADSDDDGLSDGTEEETAEPVRRPGFVDRLLSSVLG